MPNWKSYESSVRLLSAIVAAHPGMKLNYDEVGRFYGGGTKYKSVWDRMNVINKHARLLTTAVESGKDPITITLDDASANKSKAGDIAVRFGGDCTKSALENRFRRVRSDAVLINKAVAVGIDPITINVGDTDGQVVSKASKEIARCYGSDATPRAVQNIVQRHVRPDVKAIHHQLDAGGDPKHVTLTWETSRGTSDMAKHFGSDVTFKALSHVFANKINPDVKNLRAAVSVGADAKDIALSWSGGQGAIEVAKAYGSDCTKRALTTHWLRDISPNVKLVRAALDRGDDTKNVILIEGVRNGNPGKQISRIFGSDSTPGGIRFQFNDRIRPLGKRQLAMLDAGTDPKNLDLDSAKGGKSKISKYFGSDSTGGGIGFQFRQIKNDAKRQRECVETGGDPKNLIIGGGKEMARLLDDGTTRYGLEHVFRPIKKDGAAMKAAIAEKYGDGVTSKAVSERFVRLKREPEWDLTNNVVTGAKGTPRKRGSATPKKVKKAKDFDSNDDDDESLADETPSKKVKSSLHKTQGGRVTKSTPNRAARPAPGKFTENEEDEDDMSRIVKEENDTGYGSFNSTDDNGYSRAHMPEYSIEGQDTFYEADGYDA